MAFARVHLKTYEEVKEKLIKVKLSEQKTKTSRTLTVEYLFDEWLNMKKLCVKECGHSTKIVITSPKSTSSARTIPLPEFLLSILREFAPSDRNSYFLSETEKITP